MTDRELLELAAMAAGIALSHWNDGLEPYSSGEGYVLLDNRLWNPLLDDGNALRLAVKLRIDIDHGSPLDNSRYVCASCCGIEMVRDAVRAVEEFEDDVGVQRAYSTRRAIVRAAAELAKQEVKT